MATPNYEQIQSFGNVTKQLQEAAFQEFMERIEVSMTFDEIMEQAVEVAAKFRMLGKELGAQWYDLCTELAGINADPAEISTDNPDDIRASARNAVERTSNPNVTAVFNSFLSNEIEKSIRETGTDNLWRDYERGLTSGKWARVPVGDTCAWCLVLASQGAWYVSEKSALSTTDGNKYHADCDCIAVYHAAPEDINGYSKLREYKEMYYDADNMRIANRNGKKPYSKDLDQRVKLAKKHHIEREDKREQEAAERGEEYERVPWTNTNETMVVMRYQHPGMH